MEESVVAGQRCSALGLPTLYGLAATTISLVGLFGQVFQFFIDFHEDNPEMASSGLKGELAMRYLEVERASNEEAIRMVLTRGRELGVLGASRRIEIRVRLLWFAAAEAVTNSFVDDPEGNQMLFEEIRRIARAVNTNQGDNEQWTTQRQ